jgi:hypothetical protein
MPGYKDLFVPEILSTEQLHQDLSERGFRDPIRIQLAVAEIARRLSLNQTRLLEAQNLQLEAQGEQNKAQLKTAESLERATWWLTRSTFVLAVATLALVVVMFLMWRSK